MIFFEAASIINSRPIGIITGSDPRCPDPITPNHLVLGRSTSDVATGAYDNTRNVNRRYKQALNLVENWWSNWYERVLPSLVPSYKWLLRHRNVKVGDVCLIRYKNEVRATFRLGRITEVKEGFTVKDLLIEDNTVVGVQGTNKDGNPEDIAATVVLGADGYN